jgi:multidrug efflux system membrane fusion protein
MAFAVSGVLIAASNGCQRKAVQAPADVPPIIPVSRPVQREITDYVYYTGRIDAMQSVDIRSRVTGYLTKMPFKEGSEVKAGDLLFEVDPRPYKAAFDAYTAQVQLKEAAYRLAKSENRRSQAIAKNVSGSISPEDLEKSLSQEAQSLADLNLAKANLQLAKLNLEFTEVKSPIAGHVSRYFYTLGNLVSQDQTLLTTVVTVDPMYVFFDMDERTVIRIRKAVNEGKIKARDVSEVPVNMELEGEDGYPHKGRLNFFNNVVNLSTGTITARGEFANPQPPRGRRLLTPAMFVRIQVPVGQPHASLLVIDRALQFDQGLRYVYIINSQNKVEYRRVKAGALQDDGLRAIEEGLEPNDLVVVGGLPQLRPLMTVETEVVAMPTLGANETGGPASAPPPHGAPGTTPRDAETSGPPGAGKPAAPDSGDSSNETSRKSTR